MPSTTIKIIIFPLLILLSGCETISNSGQNVPEIKPDNTWTFDRTFNHKVIDASPLAEYRINDIQIGDINMDGKPDIWVSGRGGGDNSYQMAWYRNPDWVRFNIAKGDYKYGNLADFDSDGDLDIVVSQYWFENTGDYEGKDWPRYSLGYTEEPDLVHVADINDDGLEDIVFTTKNELWLLLNNKEKKENWNKELIYKEEGKRTGGDTGDIDSDGDIDILWGNAWYENISGKNGPHWKKNLIDPDWPAEARGQIADINSDGNMDIVLSDEEGDRGISVYLSDKSGGNIAWSKNVISDEYSGVHTLQVDDFNKDGRPDILAAEMHHGDDPDKIAVFENLDESGNNWREHILGGSGSHNAKSGDLDNDGYPEIVGKNYQAGALPLRIDVWENSSTSDIVQVNRWERHIIDHDRPWKAMFIYCGDINNDKLPDVITGGWWYKNPGSAHQSWTRFPIGDDFKNIAVVEDLDNDGDLDMLGTTGVTNDNDLVFAENSGDGQFVISDRIPNTEGDFLQGATSGQIIPGDEPEFVLSWHNKIDTQILRKDNGSGGDWKLESLSKTNKGEQIDLGDVDLDGDLDVHLGTVWIENADSGWVTHKTVSLSTRNGDPDRVKLADINRDGLLDAVIGCEHANCVVWVENATNGPGGWKEHIVSEQMLAMSLDTGDIDKDGDIDIVAGEHNKKEPFSGRVVIYQNLNNGADWKETVIDSGLEHHDGTQFCDIDNDSDLDIISIGWLHPNVVVYENKAIN